MRKLIFGINLAIDGCCDHTRMIVDEDLHEYWADLLREAGTLLYGRKTYQLMVPFWPDVAKNHSGQTKAMNEFAQVFDAVPNIVVVSKTLDKAEGKNTRIVRTDLRDEVLRLKQEEGKDILAGGVDLPSQLIELGLVDEYLFVVQPILAGEGRKLLDGISLPGKLKLTLIGSKTFESGCVALRYSKS